MRFVVCAEHVAIQTVLSLDDRSIEKTGHQARCDRLQPSIVFVAVSCSVGNFTLEGQYKSCWDRNR